MRCLILPSLFSVVLFAGPAFGQTSSLFSGWRPYANIHLREASDAVPVRKFDGDWSEGFSPDDGRNVMLQRYRAEVGMENDDWSIGWEKRHEAFLDTDRATLELVRLYKQRIDPAIGTRFNAQARLEGWSAHGLRVARRFDGPRISGMLPRLQVSAALYADARYRDNDVSGSVTYAAADTYRFNAAQSDANTRYRYPFMSQDPDASGLSLSLAMVLPLNDALALQLKFDDLWSRIRLRNLPVMQRTINSDVADRDAQGYINYRPVMSGMNRQVDRNVSLPRSNSAMLSYDAGPWTFAGQIERWSGVTIPTLALSHTQSWGKVTANIETRFNSVGLGVEVGGFQFQVQSDKLRLDRAKALGLQIAYRVTH